MKKTLAFAALSFLLVAMSFAQVVTANEFFKSVSDKYAGLKDYEVDLDISTEGRNMQGHASYKMPQLLRIDFSSPANQVFLFNGEELLIYLPNQAAILEQKISADSGANVATAQGLSLLRRYYSVAYETGQAPVPLEEGSSTMVVNLILYRRSAAESFTSIKISILPDSKLIRRIEAKTPSSGVYKFDYYNYKLNSGIPNERFQYDPPSNANNYNNFLLSE